MKSHAISIGALTGLAFLAITGCQTKGPRFEPRKPEAGAPVSFTEVALTNTIRPEWLKPPQELFSLGPGDRIEVELLGAESYRQPLVVGPDGKVYFYLLPGLDVWGKTLAEVKALFESELAKFLREPGQVSVSLRGVESKRVWALGRLNAPGLYPLSSPLTVLELLSQAGGAFVTGPTGSMESLADLRHSFIIRQGQYVPLDFYALLHEGNMSQNIYLQPDDFIYIPAASAREIYVLGAVLQPRSVPYTETITLVSALSSVGGPRPDAYQSRVAILRGSLNRPRIAVVNYRDIVRGKATDIPLEPRDIIYVPISPYDLVEKLVTEALSTFVRTVAINAGTRAVDPNARAVGTSVPAN